MLDCGGSAGEAVNRFVCPNDRQLALRAKLKTGWSVKTASLTGYHQSNSTNQKLGQDELAAIVDVIKRAEIVETNEHERVSRLVDRLDNLRRNALGRNPNQCLLCGEGFGILRAQKNICQDCGRLVCQKCSIVESNQPKKKNQNSLCLICAETREIWKKSGAWFFKSIPKFVSTSEKYNKINQKQPKITKNKEEESSSDEDRKLWNRRDSSTESSHDVNETSTNPVDAISTSSTIKNNNENTQESEPLRSYQSLAGSDCCRWDEETMDTEQSRRESMASRSISDCNNWSESTTTAKSSDEKMSPSTSSVSSSTNIFKQCSSTTSESLGTIQLSLTYDPVLATLQCTVYRAKNLISMDINGLSDPFCKLNILPNEKVSTRLRTKTVHKTRNPEFNENLTFYEISESDLAEKSLHILVVDDDRFGHDFMGETRIELAKLRAQNTIYLTANLEQLKGEQRGPLPTPELHQWFDDLWSRGQIMLGLCYSTKRRALLVSVCKCANLLPMDNNGFSDPFVKLQLRPDPYHRKHKTSIKWKNLNPTYNEEFAFETRPNELATQSLYVTVYDKDYGKSNDYLGGLILGGTGSKGQRLKQWLDMIRYPDHRHVAWHNLTEQVLE